jgi:hypothetical protein
MKDLYVALVIFRHEAGGVNIVVRGPRMVAVRKFEYTMY